MSDCFVLQETISGPRGDDKAYLRFTGHQTPERVPFAGQATKFTKEKAQRFADVFAQKTPPSEKAKIWLKVVDCGEEFHCAKCGRAYCRIDMESSIHASPVSSFGAVTGFIHFTCECGGDVPFDQLHFSADKVNPSEPTTSVTPQLTPSPTPAKSAAQSQAESESRGKKWWEFWR